MKLTLSASQVAAVAAAAITMGVLLAFTSCESGGGSSPSGTSTVQGNVSSFTTGTALFLPAPKSRGFERILRGLSDLIVPSAHAAGMGGVGVRMVGTDLHATTGEDGSFVMSGVPGGDHQMQFSFNGANAYMDINVPDDSTVSLHDVNCRGSVASVGHMDVQMHSSNTSTNGMPMNANANSSGNNMMQQTVRELLPSFERGFCTAAMRCATSHLGGFSHENEL